MARRARWHTAGLFTIITLTSGGCATEITLPPPAGDMPVVVGQLEAGTDVTRFTVFWSVPSPALLGRPVAAADVDLVLAESGGSGAPLLAVPDSGGVFRATLPIIGGRTYALHGRVAGIPVTGTTTVPEPLDIVAPRGGPFPRPGPLARDLPFHFRSRGSVSFHFTGLAHGSWRGVRDTLGSLAEYWFPFGSDTAASATTVKVTGYNADWDAWAGSTDFTLSNLTGVFGVLGGTASATTVLQWQ